MSQNVGYIYRVMTKEYDKAIEVYNLCISNGGSMNNLGFLYEYNLNDLNKAFEAYKKSAEYNDPAGSTMLLLWKRYFCKYDRI